MKSKVIVLCVSLAMILSACGKESDAKDVNASDTKSTNEASVEAEEQNDASGEEESQNKAAVEWQAKDKDSVADSVDGEEPVEVYDEKIVASQWGKDIKKVTFIMLDKRGYASIRFEFVDGTVQEFESYIMYLGWIKSIEFLDIDNDGECEYVIQYGFINTATEFNITQAFKLDGRDVVDISPDNVIPELKDEVVHSKIIKKEIDGKELNAIRVCTYGKEDGMAYTKYDAIIYCKDGKWTSIAAPDDHDIW